MSAESLSVVQKTEYTVYKWRFIIAIVFALSSIMSSYILATFAAIFTYTEDYFDCSSDAVGCALKVNSK
jgi:uncharacterized membrane protein YukC